MSLKERRGHKRFIMSGDSNKAICLRLVYQTLKDTIRIHGPINDGNVHCAAKRIAGQIVSRFQHDEEEIQRKRNEMGQ